jgi:hypothetical protein
MNLKPPAEEITLVQLLLYVLAILFVVGAYLYMDTERFEQEQIDAQDLEAARQAQIDTMKRADTQRLAERANRMMSPCCQASVK